MKTGDGSGMNTEDRRRETGVNEERSVNKKRRI
jgi:hypothetical protein